MNLDEYTHKRDFSISPEPAASYPSVKNSPARPIFIVQKHQAAHLHYDLRLELDGVLKSWAVPKGPSLDPSQKRLAIEVEDHPLNYRNFEGVIPRGNYGAGSVIVWDEGTYLVPNCNDSECIQQVLRDNFKKGNLVFILDGKKLKGAFHLVRLNRKDTNEQWLLIKKEDSFSSNNNILLMNRSVRTGRTIEEITLKSSNSSIQSDLTKLDLFGAGKQPLPTHPIAPMLAQLIASPFDGDDWFFEIKWDGYRAIAETRKSGLLFYSRHANSFINAYSQIADELSKISFEAIFDGEIVALDNEGRADFGTLQNYQRTKKGLLIYFVFDLLYFENYDLKRLPLYKRKSILKQILPSLSHIHFCEHIVKEGKAFFNAAKENHLEGIVAKNKNSPYIIGNRSPYWQKIKISLNQEFVIGGFTEPRGGRSGIGSLLLGVYDNSDLIYVGNVGSGFTSEELPPLRKRLEGIKTTNSPFKSTPFKGTECTWIQPILVCEVQFAEWTSDGFLRHPAFKGFRTDISPQNVIREIPSKIDSADLKLTRAFDKDAFVKIGDITLKLTNTKKIYWPQSGITKGDMIAYYQMVCDWILPHLFDRPQVLHRFPDGVEGKHFYNKDIENAPEWISTISISSDIDKKTNNYLLCQNSASLIYIANLGALEFNPWISRVGHLDYPDYMIIDLDPLLCSFEQVKTTANAVHEILTRIDTPHYLKTSGATGLHICVPLGAQYTYEQSRQFAMIICSLVNKRLSKITSMERMPEKRKGKVYLDYLQNIKGKTIAAPYSLRPSPLATVSAPLQWEELQKELSPEHFTIHNIKERLDSFDDLWKPVIGRGIDMQKCLHRLSVVFDIREITNDKI